MNSYLLARPKGAHHSLLYFWKMLPEPLRVFAYKNCYDSEEISVEFSITERRLQTVLTPLNEFDSKVICFVYFTDETLYFEALFYEGGPEQFSKAIAFSKFVKKIVSL